MYAYMYERLNRNSARILHYSENKPQIYKVKIEKEVTQCFSYIVYMFNKRFGLWGEPTLLWCEINELVYPNK